MAGPDEIQSRGYSLSLQRLGKPVSASARRRVVRRSDGAGIESRTQPCRSRRGAALRDAGATVDDSARPDFSSKASQTAFQFLLQATMSSRIPDTDFQLVARAHCARTAGRRRQRPRQHAARPSSVVQGLEPPQRSAHAPALGVACVLPTLRRAADADHADVGVPARSPLVRRTHHRRRRRETPVLRAGVLGGLAGVSSLPATIIPTGPDAQGLPIGVQIIGPEYGDLATIEVAQILEQRGFSFRSPPGY